MELCNWIEDRFKTFFLETHSNLSKRSTDLNVKENMIKNVRSFENLNEGVLNVNELNLQT